MFAPVRAARARRSMHWTQLDIASSPADGSNSRAIRTPASNSPIMMPAGEMRHASSIDVCLCSAALSGVLRKGSVLYPEVLLAGVW